MSNKNKVLIVYNPLAGLAIKSIALPGIKAYLNKNKIEYEVLFIKGETSLKAKIREKIFLGFDTFLAAGGDGTVSLLADALYGSNFSLGIIPLGTGNLIGLELNIPMDVKKALDLVFFDANRIVSIDGMLVNGERLFLLNVSTGVSSEIMALTEQNEKRVIGRFGYIHCFLKQLSHINTNSYTIEVDGISHTHLASEVIVSNGKFVGFKPFKWREVSSFEDGKLNIHIVRIKNIWEVFLFAFSLSIFPVDLSAIVDNFEFQEIVKIVTPQPVMVQADGDRIGVTPLKIELVKHACNLIVPE